MNTSSSPTSASAWLFVPPTSAIKRVGFASDVQRGTGISLSVPAVLEPVPAADISPASFVSASSAASSPQPNAKTSEQVTTAKARIELDDPSMAARVPKLGAGFKNQLN